MVRLWIAFGLLWVLPGPGLAAPAPDTLVGALTLSKALEFALSHSPDLAASRYGVTLREGEVLQARLPANPEVSIEAENLKAKGALSGENQELTARVSQTVDLSQIPRAAVAVREKHLAQLEMEAVRKRVRARVRQQFVSLLAAQEHIALSKELVQLAGTAHGFAAERVRSGKAPPTDSLQSLVALALARIDSGNAADEVGLTRKALASACGQPVVTFDSADGRLGPVKSVPPWETLVASVPVSPEWKRSDLEGRVRDAEIRAEKSARVPPITLEAGIRQVPNQDGRAFVAGLSLPLPVWNWNQGAIRSAKARKAKAGEEGKIQRLDFLDRLAGLHNQAASSYREATMLASQVLPAATATFAGAQEAYRLGKFGSLDALNAQRALFEARSHYLSALTAHHMAVAELEELLEKEMNHVR